MSDSISGIIKDYTHYLPKRVYFSDTDAGGVVYHSRYLDMAEHGRSELMRLLGGRHFEMMKKDGLVFVVRSLTVDYNRPGFLEDLLTVETRIRKCENFSMVFEQSIKRDDVPLAGLEVKIGCISMESGRPSPMPREWKQSIETVLLPPAGTRVC